MFEESEEPQDLWKAFEQGNARERAESLSELAEANFAKLDYASSFTCAQESEALYTTLDDSYGIAHARFLQGRALRFSRKYPEALELLSKAAEAFTPNARQTYRAWALFERATCYGKLQQHRLAQADFHAAGQLWSEEQMGGLAGMAFTESGEALLEQDLYHEAEFEAGQALDVLEESDDFMQRARALSVRSKVFQRQENYDQAIADNLDCANILKYLQHERLAAEVATDLASIFLDCKQFDNALTAIENARELYVENPHVLGSAECDYLNAQVCFAMGLVDEAKELAGRALSAFAVTSKKQRTFDCEYLLGLIEASVDPLYGAAAFERAISRAQKSGHTLKGHQVYVELANCYLNLDRYDSALATIREAKQPFLKPVQWQAAGALEARILLLLERPGEALQIVAGAEPQDIHQLETKGRAQLLLGETQAAVQTLTSVLVSATLAGESKVCTRVAKHLAELGQEQEPH